MTRSETNAAWSALRQEFDALEKEDLGDIWKIWIRNGKMRFVLQEMINILNKTPDEIIKQIDDNGNIAVGRCSIPDCWPSDLVNEPLRDK